MLTDDPSADAVRVYDRASDGKLRSAASYATDGVDGSTFGCSGGRPGDTSGDGPAWQRLPRGLQREAERREMRVAGIRRVGARVEMIEVGELRRLASDEVLLEVRAAGVASWDEFVRTGGWDVGGRPPMALGVEAAGTVLEAGQAVSDWAPGDAVMTHPVPLQDQGTWAPRLIAPAGLLARKPPGASWEAAAAFPVPAIIAEEVLGDAFSIRAGEPLLIHGAGGVTGGLLAALAVLRGAEVIAAAGPLSRQRVGACQTD